MALASYDRLRDPTAAEVAFAVADELQGLGIATRLLEQLALRAPRRAASSASSSRSCPDNPAMLRVVADAGLRGRAARPPAA